MYNCNLHSSLIKLFGQRFAFITYYQSSIYLCPVDLTHDQGALDVTTAHAVHKTRRYHYMARISAILYVKSTKLLLSRNFLSLDALFLDGMHAVLVLGCMSLYQCWSLDAPQISKQRGFLIHLLCTYRFAGKRNSLHFCYHIEKAVEGQ